MALRSWRPADGADHVPMGSVDAALAALRAGDVDAAMVPIENSVEGGVSATLDALANGEPLVVVGEVLVPITFVLAAPAGTPLASIRSVGTHPHAWAQVRGWMGGAPAGGDVRPGPVHRGRRRGAGRRRRVVRRCGVRPGRRRRTTGWRCWPRGSVTTPAR